MRGISAHSNGFQTCRALHLLQILLGSVEVPGGFRFKPPYPKPVHGPPETRMRKASRANRWPARIWGSYTGRTIWRLTTTARPLRIDKAFSWDHPMSSHGLMHMVISNAPRR